MQRGKRILIILAGVLVAAALLAGVGLVLIMERGGGKIETVEAPQTTTAPPVVTTVVTTSATIQSTTTAPQTTTTEAATTAPPVQTTALPVAPPVNYDMHIQMSDVTNAHSVNPDVVGWIFINGTAVNYPVVKGADNDYYIHRNWKGGSAYEGCIYEDFRGDIDYTPNTILYGHNMASGRMFHALKNYKSESWGRSHMYIEIASLEHRYLYRVLACSVLNGESGAAYQYWNFFGMNRSQFIKYLRQMKKSASVWYGYDGTPPVYGTSRLVALQTCNSGSDDGIRCVVFAECLGER